MRGTTVRDFQIISELDVGSFDSYRDISMFPPNHTQNIRARSQDIFTSSLKRLERQAGNFALSTTEYKINIFLHIDYLQAIWSRGGSISIMSDYILHDQGSIPGRGRALFL
jgi:hypothetical protein